MELRDYQAKALFQFAGFVDALKAARAEEDDYLSFQARRGQKASRSDFATKAWNEMQHQGEPPNASPYIDRRDGLGRVVPNVCLKVPTGGGKTLMAVHAVERVFLDYLGRQTGLLIWIVPSDAIFTQTWRHLANREHPYRRVLDRLSGGRLKLLKKGDQFTRADVEGNLCVLMLMLQSAGRQSTETLRLFRDTGSFSSFFPRLDDRKRNERLLANIPNLDAHVPAGAKHQAQDGTLILHSLGNVLRLLRPTIVVDEGHRAYSELAKSTIAGLNPCFVLELTATPNASGRHSNVLVDVPGMALKREGMIKLPLTLSIESGGWKQALSASFYKRAELEHAANRIQSTWNRRIRPILLVRVERTGKDKRDGAHVHAEDARQFLESNLGVKKTEIRIKSASIDELGDDDLLADDCEVRYVITKDALREGWDCPFAYILCALSSTTASMALTQMIGRVLRQPYAVRSPSGVLNQAYVYCYEQDVRDAVDSVKRGLEDEGMSDVDGAVRVVGAGGRPTSTIRVGRRRPWQSTRIFAPRVNHRSGRGELRPLDYDRDILACVKWADIAAPSLPSKLLSDAHLGARVTIDLVEREGEPAIATRSVRKAAGKQPTNDLAVLSRQLGDLIPNAWHAARVVEETCTRAVRRFGVDVAAGAQRHLVDVMRTGITKQLLAGCEDIFVEKLRRGDIKCDLSVVNDLHLNWEMAKTLELEVARGDRALRDQNDDDLRRAVYEKVFERDLNGFERNIALYLDSHQAVQWWHRLVARAQGEYFLQGWRRERVYPDFLVAVRHQRRGKSKLIVMETKGSHLKGSDDTIYKKRLLDILSVASESGLPIGRVRMRKSSGTPVEFRMVLQDTWRSDLGLAVGGR